MGVAAVGGGCGGGCDERQVTERWPLNYLPPVVSADGAPVGDDKGGERMARVHTL